jgi:hypothetical protein
MRLLLAFALLFAGDPTRIELEPLPRASVAAVQGTGAFVAVSREGQKLRVYVCDGTLRRDAKVSVWFSGRAGARTLRSGGHTLKLDADGAAGSFDGHAFRLRAARFPAGLFEGRRGGTTTTWIVLSDRRKRGTFVPTRPPKCRFVLVSGPNGQQQWVSVC